MLPTIRFQLETDMQAEYAWIIRAWGRYSGFTPLFVETEPELTVSELGISDIRLSHFFGIPICMAIIMRRPILQPHRYTCMPGDRQII